LNIVQVFYAAILGYFIGVAVIATRSIWAGVIMHFMNNAIGTYLSYAGQNGLPFADLFDPIFNLMAGAGGLLMLGLFIWFIYWAITSITHMFARDNFQKNEKFYIARFIRGNPEIISKRIERGEGVSMEELSTLIKQNVARLRKRDAIRFYIEDPEPKQRLKPLEKTLIFGILFFGILVTAFTFVWGML